MTLIIGGLVERDLDIALAAALRTSHAFRRLILKHIGAPDTEHELVGVHVSHWTPLGETDVLLVIRQTTGSRLAVMIENKIDAAFQPNQAERYKLRGRKGKDWEYFVTVLCGPEKYIAEERKLNTWVAYLSIEDILAKR